MPLSLYVCRQSPFFLTFHSGGSVMAVFYVNVENVLNTRHLEVACVL